MLAGYSSLQLLRMTQIPLFAGKGASEVRPLVISRIKQLQIFNGSKISTREREDSEKTYLRLILREKESIMKDKPEEEVTRGLQLFHPRYQELYARYGQDIAPAAYAATGAGTLASEVVSITFRNLSFGSNGSLEPVVKKLPKTTNVGKTRLLVKQLFGLEPRLQQLSMRVYKDSVPTVLDDDQATLSYYGAIDGAEIFVNEDKA